MNTTAYPARPQIVQSRSLALVSKYVIPVTGRDAVELVRRAVKRTPRVMLTDLTSEVAHIGYRAVAGIGYETIILTFKEDGDSGTLIDCVDRGVVGTVNTFPRRLPALLDSIVAEIQLLHNGGSIEGRS